MQMRTEKDGVEARKQIGYLVVSSIVSTYLIYHRTNILFRAGRPLDGHGRGSDAPPVPKIANLRYLRLAALHFGTLVALAELS
jgi:hypothetical protein